MLQYPGDVGAGLLDQIVQGAGLLAPDQRFTPLACPGLSRSFVSFLLRVIAGGDQEGLNEGVLP